MDPNEIFWGISWFVDVPKITALNSSGRCAPRHYIGGRYIHKPVAAESFCSRVDLVMRLLLFWLEATSVEFY